MGTAYTINGHEITVELIQGGSLNEFAAHGPNGQYYTAKGSCFECVGEDGYMTPDTEFMARSAATAWGLDKP